MVELFQSQGCSSCPPANANLMAVAGRPDVLKLALSFGVTYWDQLGWKDTFASRQNTDRQWDYAHGLGHSNVFTPQVVVNGRRDGDGIGPGDFAALVRAGDRGAAGPVVNVSAGTVSIGAGSPGRAAADVWLVRYDPRIVQVPIKRGENGGKTLPHRNVVRQLVRLGAWDGRAASLRIPASADPALKTAILVRVPSRAARSWPRRGAGAPSHAGNSSMAGAVPVVFGRVTNDSDTRAAPASALEGRLKALMLRGLDGDGAAQSELLSMLSRYLRAYFWAAAGRGLGGRRGPGPGDADRHPPEARHLGPEPGVHAMGLWRGALQAAGPFPARGPAGGGAAGGGRGPVRGRGQRRARGAAGPSAS